MKKGSLLEANNLQPHALGGGLEGAKTTTREMMRWRPPAGSPDAIINSSKKMADDRSRDLVQNDGYLAGVLHLTRDSIIGACYRMISQPNLDVLKALDSRFDEAWMLDFQSVVEARFNLVAESRSNWLDASRKDTLTGLVRLATGIHVYTGEVLMSAEWIREGDRPFNTAVQLIAPDRLCNPNDEWDTQYLRRGVEINDWDRPIAYHIRQGYQSDPYSFGSEVNWRRVEAQKPWGRKMMIHIMERDMAGQTRAVSEMVAALKQMRMTRRFQDITLQNAVINASYAATMESELPMEMLGPAMGGNSLTDFCGQFMTSLQQYMGGANNLTIDGATIPVLFPNTKLNMQPMGTPGGVGTVFEQSLLRHIAASLGLSYEEFARDFTNTNYSSARAGMSGTRKRLNAKKKMVADRTASEIFDLWFEEDLARGNIPLPAGIGRSIFYRPLAKEALTQCEWIGSGQGQIDEVKETQAAIMRINAGLSTYEREAALLGGYFKEILRTRKREQQQIQEAGLVFNSDATKPGTNDRQQTMTADDQETDNGNG